MNAPSPQISMDEIELEFFELLAGPQHKRFLVHADILCQSDKFKATVQGSWKDSTERKILLEEWDAETVSRLVQWLYQKDYSAPYPKETEHKSKTFTINPAPPPRPRDTFVNLRWTASSPPANHTKDDGSLDEDSHVEPLKPVASMRYGRMSSQLPNPLSKSPRRWISDNITPSQTLDCNDVLMTNSKLYALAGYVLLPTLQALAFSRIQEVLIFVGPLQPGTPLIGNLVSLIRYVYTNTDSLANSEEPLRNLITTYIAHNFANFRGEEVECLEEEGGDYVREVCAKVKQHTAYLEQAMEEKLESPRASEMGRFNPAFAHSYGPPRGGRGGPSGQAGLVLGRMDT